MITEMAQRITQENSVMKLEKGMCGRSDYSGSEGEQMEAESSQNVYEWLKMSKTIKMVNFKV